MKRVGGLSIAAGVPRAVWIDDGPVGGCRSSQKRVGLRRRRGRCRQGGRCRDCRRGCCHGVADDRVVLSSSPYPRPIPASPRIRSAPSESGFADREWHGQPCHGLRGCPFRPFTAPSPPILPLSTRSGCRARPCPVARMQTPVRRIAVTRRTEGSLHGRVHVCSCRRGCGARPADGRGRTIAAGRSGSCWRSRRSSPGISSSGAIGLPVNGCQWA